MKIHMKITQFILFFAALLFIVSCGKNDDQIFTPNPGEYFRLQAMDVDVLPQYRQVRVLFQVTDFDRKGFAGLEDDQLDVFENGHLVDLEGDVRLAPDSIPYQLKTVLVLDISKSIEGFVPNIKAACKSLIDKKLEDQEIAIYTFDNKVNRIVPFTKNADVLYAAIDGIEETDLTGSTNLYEAIIEAADEWNDIYTVNTLVDGSMVVFTDGRHNAIPSITIEHALTATEGKKVFIAALQSVDLDEVALKQIAGNQERYFKADDVASLETMFTNIQEEILGISRSVYYMYYTSPISDPSPYTNDLMLEISGNQNRGSDASIITTFNSEGFGL